MAGTGSCDGAEAEDDAAIDDSAVDEVDADVFVDTAADSDVTAPDADGSAAGVEDCDEAADTAEADS